MSKTKVGYSIKDKTKIGYSIDVKTKDKTKLSNESIELYNSLLDLSWAEPYIVIDLSLIHI